MSSIPASSFLQMVLQQLPFLQKEPLNQSFYSLCKSALGIEDSSEIATELVALASKLGPGVLQDQTLLLAAVTLKDAPLCGALCRRFHQKQQSADQLLGTHREPLPPMGASQKGRSLLAVRAEVFPATDKRK